MFERFESEFNKTASVECTTEIDLLSKIEPYALGFTELMKKFGGSTFNNGLYRMHRPENILEWTHNAERAFPKYKGRIVCFSYDWLGRQFALDKKRTDKNQMLILLLEPGTGEALEIPVTFSNLHNEELVQYKNEALASNFFAEWIESGGGAPDKSQCVGYKIPLFLSGSDSIDNLEVNDLDVYWSICGQALNANARS